MPYDVSIAPKRRAAIFSLQGEATTVAAALTPLGLELPATANTVRRFETLDVFWIGRTRWLLRGPIDAEHELARRLERLHEAPGTDAMCVSDHYAGLALEGADTRAVLSQTCPLDLHESVFGLGSASFTSVFSLRGLLHFESRPASFAVYVEASFVDYLRACFDYAIGQTSG